MTDNLAYFILNLVPGFGPRRTNRIIARLGGVRSVLEASEYDLQSCEGIGPELARALASWRHTLPWEEELALVDAEGANILTPADAEYPELLRTLPDAPLALYRLGGGSSADVHSLAIVGSRAASPYGLSVARKLSRQVAAAGMPVVSGLARGIDTAAHLGTLDGGGRTIAVLGGGLLHLYPKENKELARRIVNEGGCLLSEFPMRRAPDKQSFAIRNRIVAGMCRATLVVEAPRHSGALITARMAREMGREVMAVPGRIDTPHASGCHQLIKDGAKLIEGFDDIAHVFNDLFTGIVSSDSFDSSVAAADEAENPTSNNARIRDTANGDALSDRERQILHCLSDGPLDSESLAETLSLPAHLTNATLSRLEMRKLILLQTDGRYALRGGV